MHLPVLAPVAQTLHPVGLLEAGAGSALVTVVVRAGGEQLGWGRHHPALTAGWGGSGGKTEVDRLELGGGGGGGGDRGNGEAAGPQAQPARLPHLEHAGGPGVYPVEAARCRLCWCVCMSVAARALQRSSLGVSHHLAVLTQSFQHATSFASAQLLPWKIIVTL